MNRKEIKETEERFNRAWTLKQSVNLLMSNVIKDCMEYLKGVLKEYNGRIVMHVYDEDGVQEDDTSFCVSYDGGHHPEYGSNVFSEVEVIVHLENICKSAIFLAHHYIRNLCRKQTYCCIIPVRID